MIELVFAACGVLLMCFGWIRMINSGRETRKHLEAQDAEWNRQNWDKWMKRIEADCEHRRQWAKDAAELSRRNADALAFMQTRRGCDT